MPLVIPPRPSIDRPSSSWYVLFAPNPTRTPASQPAHDALLAFCHHRNHAGHVAFDGCDVLLTRISQAHRFVLTAFVTGSRILGRSFMAAYKQAQAASQYQRAQAKSGGSANGGGGASLSAGMTLDEACKILNVKPPAGGQANVEEVMQRYKRLFDSNEPANGGSFYLQSKIVRAKERFERELGPLREKLEAEAETQEGFKPKIYKDR